jgi:hypothetical protein
MIRIVAQELIYDLCRAGPVAAGERRSGPCKYFLWIGASRCSQKPQRYRGQGDSDYRGKNPRRYRLINGQHAVIRIPTCNDFGSPLAPREVPQ